MAFLMEQIHAMKLFLEAARISELHFVPLFLKNEYFMFLKNLVWILAFLAALNK